MTDEEFMALAVDCALRANCHGHKVGAILATKRPALKTWTIVAAGWNGTPVGMDDCQAGGCQRCDNRDTYQPGLFYDMCVCVHAEQAVLLQCARLGIPTTNTVLYTTMKPCLGCCKELIQAGVREVVYQEDWELRMPFFKPSHDKMLELLNTRRVP